MPPMLPRHIGGYDLDHMPILQTVAGRPLSRFFNHFRIKFSLKAMASRNETNYVDENSPH